MQQFLTKGIGHNKFKETPLGKIPETWKIIPLKKVVKEHKAGIYKKKCFPYH